MSAMLIVPGVVCLVLVLLLRCPVAGPASARPEARAGMRWITFLHTFWLNPRSRARFRLGLCRPVLPDPVHVVPDGLSALLPDEPARRAAEAVPDVVFRSTLVQAVGVVLAGLLAGRLSDLTHRRQAVRDRRPVSPCALGSWLVASAPSYEAFLAGMTVFGIGLGRVPERRLRAGDGRAAEPGRRRGQGSRPI